MDHWLFPLLLVLALAFANGTNDVSKAIATLVGSGVSSYRAAILWGTVWTVLGSLLAASIASAMVKTFSTGVIQPELTIPPVLGLAILIGAMAWVLFASQTGLPVSTTHALTGAMIGGGLTTFGADGILWSPLIGKIALPLLLSPVLALAASMLIHPMVRMVGDRWEGACLCLMPEYRAVVAINAQGATRTLFQATGLGQPIAATPSHCDRANLSGLTLGPDSIHWLSSGLASLARGTNDAPKIVAILLLGGTAMSWDYPFTQVVAFAGVAIAMGLGSLLGGLRVTQVLAEKVTKMNHLEGLSANVTTSSLVLISTTMGLPVSTTHVSSSAIVGIGLLKGLRSVQWSTVRDMVLAWVVTLPAAGLLAGLAYLLLVKWL